jgi:hypothetical protein
MRLGFAVLLLAGCASAPMPTDAGGAMDAAGADAASDAAVDAAFVDALPLDARDDDAGAVDGTLAAHRDRLFATLGATPCETWASLAASRRAVFLTITHRLFTSRTPDGLPMLAHVEALHLVLGGGSSGTTCGGAENNRLFVSTDAYLHARMVDTWNDVAVITDGIGSTWIHTRDRAGPHDPFDASIETDLGLRCTLLIETSGSRPPTAQAHFFLDGSATSIERGAGISLPADPHMLEIDQDYNCVHDSNPTCRDFTERYRTNHGDFECDWVPSACTPEGEGCYRSAR